jgi:hypothetical protein
MKFVFSKFRHTARVPFNEPLCVFAMDSPFKKRMLQPAFLFFSALPPGGQRPREGMTPEDPKNRNPRNFDHGSDLNWRGIFLFVVYTSVVLGFFLFSRNTNYGSVYGPAPSLSYDERNRGQAPIPFSERSRQTIFVRPWFKVSNEGLEPSPGLCPCEQSRRQSLGPFRRQGIK